MFCKKFLYLVETEKEFRYKDARMLADVQKGIVTESIAGNDTKMFPNSDVIRTLKTIFGDLI